MDPVEPPSTPAGLVSCLCITEDRPAFLPWLYWNYRKQDAPARELVVVDSSRRPAVSDDPTVRIIPCPRRTNIARKRNLAMDAAAGDVLLWFDDDDWQHPRRISILLQALGHDGMLAGSTASWFVDVGQGRARRYEVPHGVIFNGLAVRRRAIEAVRFDERRGRVSDTAWMKAFPADVARTTRTVPTLVSFWLCHGGNVSNPVQNHVFPRSIVEVADEVGREDWGETSEEVRRLRTRMRSEGQNRGGGGLSVLRRPGAGG